MSESPDLAGALDAVANQMQVIVGLTTELQRAARHDDAHVRELRVVVDRIVSVLRRVQPTLATTR